MNKKVAGSLLSLLIAWGCGGDSTNLGNHAPTALIRVSGNTQSAGVGEALPNALVVKVVDAQGAGVPNVSVSWSVTSGGGNLSASSTPSDQNGQALVMLTLGANPGANSVSASAAQLTPVTFTATAIGPPAKLSYAVQPTSVTAGAPIVQAVQVVVQDVQGTTVPTATTSVTLAITSGTGASGATLGGTLTQTAAAGVATFNNLTVDKAARGYTLTATASGVTSAVSTAFDVNPGTAAKLAFSTQPTTAAAGAAISPAVQVVVQDAQGNTVTGAINSTTLAIASGTGTTGATLGGTVTRAAVSGVATFSNLNINKSGIGYRLAATATSLTPVTSTLFDVTPGPATHLAFTVQPSDVIAGAPITPAVQVSILDASNNVVTTATDSIYANFSMSWGGTPSGTFRKKAINGVATFDDISIDKAHTDFRMQTFSLDRDLGVVASNLFTVNVGPPARLTFITQPRDAMDHVLFDSLKILVQDNQGNTVTASTASVTIGITSGTGAAGATLSGTSTRSAETGLVIFDDLSIDLVGTGYTLTATSAGVSNDTTVAFRVIGPLYATQVSAGLHATSCALVSGGAAYCWGYNGNGQIGDGTTNGAVAPVAVFGGLTFSAVSAGFHGCGLTVAGAAYCWGYGLDGELGQGSYADSHTPVPVSGGLTFSTVSAGVYHTCALTPSGGAYCWGGGAPGVLGDSSFGGSNTPRLVYGNHTWANVSAGYAHSCGVTTAGEGYCWGDGSYGDLGTGSLAAGYTPLAVSGGLTFDVVLPGGTSDTCGLTTSGAAYCWGGNQSGQLGDGSTSPLSTTPVPVAGGLTFASLSAGGAHYCGLTAGGAIYCWGLNRSGQLGDGTTIDRNAPVAVSGGITFTTVSAGGDRTCGIATSGIVYCWGLNGGTLGDRTTVNRSTPVRVSAP